MALIIYWHSGDDAVTTIDLSGDLVITKDSYFIKRAFPQTISIYTPLAVYTKSGNFISLSPDSSVKISYTPNKTLYNNFVFNSKTKTASIGLINHWIDMIPVMYGIDIFFDDDMVYLYSKAFVSEHNTYIFYQKLMWYINYTLESLNNYQTYGFWLDTSFSMPFEVTSDPSMMYILSGVVGRYYESLEVERRPTHEYNDRKTYKAIFYGSNNYPINFILVPGSYQKREVFTTYPIYTPVGINDALSAMTAVNMYANLTPPKPTITYSASPRNTSVMLVMQPSSYFDIKSTTYWYNSGIGGCGEPIFQVKTVGKLLELWQTVRLNQGISTSSWPSYYMYTDDDRENNNLIPSYDVWTKLDNYLKIEGPFFVKLGCVHTYREMTNSSSGPNYSFITSHSGILDVADFNHSHFPLIYGCLPYKTILPNIDYSNPTRVIDNTSTNSGGVSENNGFLYNDAYYTIDDKVIVLRVLNNKKTNISGNMIPYNCAVDSEIQSAPLNIIEINNTLSSSDLNSSFALTNLSINYRTISQEFMQTDFAIGDSTLMTINRNDRQVRCNTTPKLLTYFKDSSYAILNVCSYYNNGELWKIINRLSDTNPVNTIEMLDDYITQEPEDGIFSGAGVIGGIDYTASRYIPYQIVVDENMIGIQNIVRNTIKEYIEQYIGDNFSMLENTNIITKHITVPFMICMVKVDTSDFVKMVSLSNIFTLNVANVPGPYNFEGNNTPINKYLHHKVNNSEDVEYVYIIGRYYGKVDIKVNISKCSTQSKRYSQDRKINFYYPPMSVLYNNKGYLNTTVAIVREHIDDMYNFYIVDFDVLEFTPEHINNTDNVLLLGVINRGHLSAPSLISRTTTNEDGNSVNEIWFYNNKYIMKYEEEFTDDDINKSVKFYTPYINETISDLNMSLDDLQIYQLSNIKDINAVISWLRYLGKVELPN